jgi:hypothetical protein
MTLYRETPEISLNEARVRIGEHYERAVRSNESEDVNVRNLLALGPRSLTHPDDRSTLSQMFGLHSAYARKQMAYTYLAIGATLKALYTDGEVAS